MKEIKLEQISSKLKEEINRTSDVLEKCVRKYPIAERKADISVAILAYVLYKTSLLIKEAHRLDGISLSDVTKLNDDLRLFIEGLISEEMFDDVKKMIIETDSEVFKIIALYKNIRSYYDECNTPKSIIKLANAILDIKNNESVADICSGFGSFIFDAERKQQNCSYTGIEINVDAAYISKMRAELADEDVKIYNMDAFFFDFEKNKFDKVFSNFPFAIRNNNKDENPVSKKLSTYLGGYKPAYDDWYFVNLAVQALKANGKAVCVMGNGSLFNNSMAERKMREYFVENGLVEAVVSLASNIFSYTGIQTSIVVLSKNNQSVKFVDATNIFTPERRNNILTDENIKEITDLLNCDSDISKTVSFDEIRNNDYCLYQPRYTTKKVEYKNGVQFGSVIKSITRGASISARELDKASSIKPTKYKYLMLANIKNGIIDEELPYLKEIDEKYDKYCLKSNDLIMSKNGYPFKIAIVDNLKDDEKILANGNLYIVELDEDKADPYYIKAYFDSEEGISQLKSIIVGSTIPSFGLNDLKKLIVPLPSLEKQHTVAEKYKSARDEVVISTLRLEKAIDKLAHVFDEDKDNAK